MTAALEIDAELPGGMAVKLHLDAGETALVLGDDEHSLAALADLATGLSRPASGSIRFLGQNWAALADDAGDVLRGRIGRCFFRGGWLAHLPLAENILLPGLFQDGASRAARTEAAARWARHFLLPGLPLGMPAHFDRAELQRAALVRAFVGEPALLVLENPLDGGAVPDLMAPLLQAIAMTRNAACLWLTTSPTRWRERGGIAAQQLRLTARGLVPTMQERAA